VETATTEIVEGGPFRISRNPMYLQMVLICIGVAVMLMNVWILLLVPVCAWVLYKFAILPEETYLQSKFGEVYLAYKRRVRRWLWQEFTFCPLGARPGGLSLILQPCPTPTIRIRPGSIPTNDFASSFWPLDWSTTDRLAATTPADTRRAYSRQRLEQALESELRRTPPRRD
jgi:Phospholipid methyltransferase